MQTLFTSNKIGDKMEIIYFLIYDNFADIYLIYLLYNNEKKHLSKNE